MWYIPSINEDEGYNLLVISYPTAAERGVSYFTDSMDLISSLVSSYNGFMLLDKNRIIRFCSNKALYGRNPLELGVNEDEVRDNFLGEFTLDNDVFYGASDEINGELFYYIAKAWCLAEFTVKNNVDTEELKKLLWAELPEIRTRHKEILSDPVFTGISAINIGNITFGVRAECKESKMRRVHSILNYEIRDMLNRNNIEMP